jgi:hypothetical protein
MLAGKFAGNYPGKQTTVYETREEQRGCEGLGSATIAGRCGRQQPLKLSGSATLPSHKRTFFRGRVEASAGKPPFLSDLEG